MGPAYTYTNVISEIDVLGQAGILDEQRAISGSREWQSTFRATPAPLSAYAHALRRDFSFHIFDPIRLRDKLLNSSVLIDYRDTAKTRAMRREIKKECRLFETRCRSAWRPKNGPSLVSGKIHN